LHRHLRIPGALATAVGAVASVCGNAQVTVNFGSQNPDIEFENAEQDFAVCMVCGSGVALFLLEQTRCFVYGALLILKVLKLCFTLFIFCRRLG